MQFKDLPLSAPLLKAVEQAGYSEPTPIQAAAIPAAVAGKDVLGCARTGTGKTAAFCLPALQRADASAGDEPRLTTLILTPTRELAAQINDSLETYGKHVELWHAVLFGGVNEKPQIAELKRGVDILVATPGRLLDLMNRGFVKLDKIELFVLDEADRMLDMGFIRDVQRIAQALPKKRQTLFFSATMPPAIRKLANGLLVDPVEVSVDPVSSTVHLVDQSVYFTDKNRKRDLLEHLLNDPACGRTIVFTRTKHGSDRVARQLQRSGKSVAAIHGNKAQNARTRALDGFRDGSVQVLVATDIAARGIDVDNITHVINFDVPNVAETYVHRIGRTGRAGNTGIALSLCDHEERAYLASIERLIRQDIRRVVDHPFLPSANPPADESLHEPGRGSGGGRNGRGGNRPRAQGGNRPRAQGDNRSGAPGENRNGAQGRKRRPARRATDSAAAAR